MTPRRSNLRWNQRQAKLFLGLPGDRAEWIENSVAIDVFDVIAKASDLQVAAGS
ncbi:hypothetical protein BJ994_002698 [Arthrobacter pigmenti]|uniref:Uncharacterized protein n=1 Tax=Arthrobacter pigmenti TaxID=271432 RepID=A0A846RSW5_9MICC|nr:hypothetical protein [Arthrobacter pigmenti]NJC23622.1 hypothetical protein [Arthrobacter pigmenti]